MRAENLMTREVACIGLNQSLNDAAKLMWEHDCGCVPVVGDSGEVIAMITDRDISMAAYTQGKSLCDIPVRSAMSKQLYSCRPGDSVTHVEGLMQTHKVRRIPVLDDASHLLGIISLNDLARACCSGVKGVATRDLGATLGAISSPSSLAAPAAA
jgi:CBS domain-containing protein